MTGTSSCEFGPLGIFAKISPGGLAPSGAKNDSRRGKIGPWENWTGGRKRSAISQNAKNPHPSPLPEYRARGLDFRLRGNNFPDLRPLTSHPTKR
jgi:hypothetical protein